MNIKKLNIKNFLWTEERSLEFSQINNITWRNGVGKSSVKEAILFALYWKINWQSQNLDTAIFNWAKDMSVVLTITLDKDYIIERVKTPSKVTLKMNWAIVEQWAIDFVFWTYEEFASQLVAGEFMKFDESTRYAIINKIYPGDLEKIYIDMVWKEIAEKYPFNTIDEKSIKASLKVAEEKQQRIHHEKLTISAKIEELNTTTPPEITVNEDKLADVRMQMAMHEEKKPTLKVDTPLNSTELSLQKWELAAINLQYRKHLDNKPDRSELDRIATLYKNAEQELNAIQNGSVCPTCLRAFDWKDIETQVSQAKNKLAQLLSEWKFAKKEFEDRNFWWSEELKRLESDIESRQNKITAMNESVATGNQGSIDHYNKEMELWNTRWMELNTNLAQLNEQYRTEQVKLQAFNSSVDRVEELKLQLWQLDKDLIALDTHELNKIKECFGSKGIEFKDIESKIEKIRWYLPEWVELELIQQNKTNDGFKKVFNISMDNVPYNWLSKWMKKVLDIHLCEMLGSKWVIIIDDLESLTSQIQLVNADTQVITLTAKDCDFTFEKKELTT